MPRGYRRWNTPVGLAHAHQHGLRPPATSSSVPHAPALTANPHPTSGRLQLPPMKAVILAGGAGTRITEETLVRPKPMIEIGHKPLLWHIMKMYSAHGINDFVICLGYRGYMIKEYFANYFLH